MVARTFDEDSDHRRVLELAWPIMISMLSYTAMTVADSLFVGWLGTAELAALGVSASLVHGAMSLGMGLIGGMRVAVARSWGARRRSLARRYAWQGLWLALGLGLLVSTLAPFGRPAFLAMGASPEVADLAAGYYAVRVLGAPVLFVNVALTGWFQGRGDTRSPMAATLLANAVNVALDPVLIFGFGPVPAFGVGGAAAATVLGLLSGVVLLGALSARELGHRVSPLRRDLLRPILSVGAPRSLEHLLDVGSFVVFSSLLARAGDAHLAAHVVGLRIVLVSFLPGFAISEAAGVLVGQGLGAGRPERARAAHRAATHVAVGLMTIGGLVFVSFPDTLVGAFGPEEAVHRLAVQVLLAAAAIQLFDAVATVAIGALAGAGDTRFVLVLSVGAAWLVKVPLAVMLVGAGLGVLGAWMALACEIAVLAVLAGLRIRGEAWLRHDHGTVPVPTT